MSGSLGGLIKDYRIQKRVSQLDIALALGWRETSRLSRIEQGHIKPPRELIDQIISALKLDDTEKNHLLYVGNYLPTDEEIEHVRNKVKDYLESWEYPTTLYDFTWRVLHLNKSWLHIYQNIPLDYLYSYKPNILEILFDPEFTQNRFKPKSLITEHHNEYIQTIVQYRMDQKFRTSEEFYRNLIKKMMTNDIFVKLWQRSEHTKPLRPVANYTYDSTTIPSKDTKNRIKFQTFSLPYLDDERFFVELHIPADIKTYEYFQSLNLNLPLK